MINLAIFDMDGLIFDTERLFMQELKKAMQNKGYTLTLEIYTRMLGMNAKMCQKHMLDNYGPDYPYHEISAQARAAVNAMKTLPVKPGIRELLEFLNEKGVKCAVASSTNSEYVKKYISDNNLGKFFDCIIGGDMVVKSKPEPDIFLLACSKLGLSPADTIVFEDSESGIKAAVRGKMRVICIPDMKEHSDEIKGMCTAYVKTGFEAIEYVRNII